jgi:polysaccharide export outer membrane protein
MTNHNPVRIILLFLAAMTVLAGCTPFAYMPSGDSVINPVILRDQEEKRKAQELNELVLRSAAMRTATANLDYVIGPEDVLQIEVFQVEDLKKEVRVNYSGYIGLPVVGQVMAKGRTAGELENDLAEALGKYIKDPVVSVYVKEYKSQKILVTGAVGKPGIYSVIGQKYLLDMLFLAEGFREPGKTCYIFRPKGQGQGQAEGEGTGSETFVIDIYALITKGDQRFNVPVFSGDVIHVPPVGVVYVDGAVRKRGLHKLTGKMTVVRAIAQSEGMRFTADYSDVRILRDTGKSVRQVIEIDYTKALMDTTYDVEVQDNDIIIVGTSVIKSGISTIVLWIRPSFTFGDSNASMTVTPPTIIETW